MCGTCPSDCFVLDAFRKYRDDLRDHGRYYSKESEIINQKNNVVANANAIIGHVPAPAVFPWQHRAVAMIMSMTHLSDPLVVYCTPALVLDLVLDLSLSLGLMNSALWFSHIILKFLF